MQKCTVAQDYQHLLNCLFFLLTVFLKLCRGGSVTNLVKSLRKRGKYLDEDLIAYILYETLKVDTAEDFNFSVFDPSTGYDFDEKERHKMFIVLNFLVSFKWYFCELQNVFSLHVHS